MLLRPTGSSSAAELHLYNKLFFLIQASVDFSASVSATATSVQQ